MRGDVIDVALQNGISRQTVENVMRSRTKNQFVINLLFERALQNRKLISSNTQDMINQLKLEL